MKVGILTRRAGFNHGSSLQAYAMAKMLEHAGGSAEIIDYDEYAAHPLWQVRPIIENMQWHFMRYIIHAVSPSHYSYLYIRSKQYKRFESFERLYLPLTRERCHSAKDLNEISRRYDALVCGSDQIWSPLLYDSNYLFGFLKDSHAIRTVAYAPSFGISDSSMIGNDERRLLQLIDCLSCREERGRDIIRELTGREAALVLDPTLMLQKEEWEKLTRPLNAKKEKYILCYFLGSSIHQEYIDSLKAQANCKVVNIRMFNRMNNLVADENVSDIGPQDFLQWIANADVVCTDSFHAAIFSFIFNRKLSLFYRFNNESKTSQNSRIETLVNILNLKDSVVKNSKGGMPEATAQTREGIDNLEKYRALSWKYLHDSLSV